MCVINLELILPVVCRIVEDVVHRRNGYYSRAQDLLYQPAGRTWRAMRTQLVVVVMQMRRKMEWRVMAFLRKEIESVHCVSWLTSSDDLVRRVSPSADVCAGTVTEEPTFLLLQALEPASRLRTGD